MKAAQLILRRLGLMVVVLFIVSLLTFAIVNVLPGDVAYAILGDLGTPEQVAALRVKMGLGEPLVTRYLIWIGAVLRGDFGVSLQFDQPIGPMLVGRLSNSAVLGGITLLVAVPLSILLGVLAGVRQGRLADRIISGFAITTFALPEYAIGILLILVFSIWWPILPGSSLIDPGANPLDRPEVLVLPVAVLSLGMLAYMSQITRAGMITTLESAYIRTAVLKGLAGWHVVLKHALPNVLLPTLAEIGMNFGYVLGGIVVVETLFSYAGLGQMMVTAVNHRDIPVVEAAVLVVAAAYGIGNLCADVASIMLNPKLRA
jgi:peptide/nickel transport system permease protein